MDFWYLLIGAMLKPWEPQWVNFKKIIHVLLPLEPKLKPSCEIHCKTPVFNSRTRLIDIVRIFCVKKLFLRKPWYRCDAQSLVLMLRHAFVNIAGKNQIPECCWLQIYMDLRKITRVISCFLRAPTIYFHGCFFSIPLMLVLCIWKNGLTHMVLPHCFCWHELV